MRYLSVPAVALFAAAWAFAAPQSSTPTGDAAELRRWADNGFSVADAGPWRTTGIDPAEARQWVQAGIQFAEWAYQWKGEGFGPADARVWAEHQVNVYNYIWNKQNDAWIWSFKDGVKTTWVDDDKPEAE